MENLQLIYRSIDWCIYLYRLNAGSLTSNRFSKPTYKVAFLRHRRSSVAFPASQECDTGGLKVQFFANQISVSENQFHTGFRFYWPSLKFKFSCSSSHFQAQLNLVIYDVFTGPCQPYLTI